MRRFPPLFAPSPPPAHDDFPAPSDPPPPLKCTWNAFSKRIFIYFIAGCFCCSCCLCYWEVPLQRYAICFIRSLPAPSFLARLAPFKTTNPLKICTHAWPLSLSLSICLVAYRAPSICVSFPSLYASHEAMDQVGILVCIYVLNSYNILIFWNIQFKFDTFLSPSAMF